MKEVSKNQAFTTPKHLNIHTNKHLPYRLPGKIRGMPVQNGTIVQADIDNQRFSRTKNVQVGVQNRTNMYKKDRIIEVQYEEIGSETPSKPRNKRNRGH